MRALTIATSAIFLSGAVFAAAAEAPTREGYAAQVEPICKVNTQANERLLKNVKKEVKEGKLKLAGSQFLKAASALKGTLAELKAVPQPPADAARLSSWLRYVKIETELLEGIGKNLKAGKKKAAQQLVNRLSTNANLANSQVLVFEFHYCRFNPSKFT